MCNKKNKIAFVCSTYVQIMRMFQIKKEIPEFYGKADLYLVHDMFNNMEFIRRLENTNEFDNVFYFNVNEYKSIKVLHYIYGKKYRDIFKKNIYDKVISFNIEEVISQVLFNLNKSQENFEFHCVEDGPGGYEVYKPEQYKWSHIYRWLGIEKQYYNIKTWWTGCPEYMKFPNDCSVDIKKLPAIKIGDYKLLKTINYVFDYKNKNELDNIECLIMEESHFEDGLIPNNEDYIFYKKIISKYSNVHFAIKLHPRTKVNRFEGLIPVIKNNNAPWELILWNRIISKKSDLLQLSIACGTMMSDKFLYDYEGPKMLLARLFLDIIKPINGYRRVNEKTIDKYEKFKQSYKEPDKFMLPKEESEIYEMLDDYFQNTR